MYRRALIALMTGIVIAICWRTSPGREEQDTQIQVEVRDGQVILDARNAPLTDVLRAIGEQAGFSTVVRGSFNVRISRSLTETPIEVAVRRLAGDANVVMIYAPHTAGLAPRPIKEIRLYPSAPGGIAASRGTFVREPINPDLLAALGEDDPQARIHAVQSLGDTRESSAVAVIADVLSEDEHAAVRGQAAAVLGRVGSEEAIPALKTALGDPNQAVRVQVVRALGRIGGDRVARILGDVLKNDADQRVRTTAAWSLGSLNTELARANLRAAIPKADAIVRRSIQQSLSRQNWREEENP